MAIDDRGRLTNNNNSIDDVLHTVNMSSSSFADNKSIKLISQNAPVNPLNNNIVDFFSNYQNGPYEMEWFRNYDHYHHHSSSNLGTIPNLLTHNQIGGTDVTMNSLGWNQRSYLLSNYPDIDDRGTIGWTQESIFTYHYRGTNNSGFEAKVTSYGLGGAATTYNGNIDTEVFSTSVKTMGVAAIERGFISSSMSLAMYRNGADGDDTWGRVIKVSSTGVITFENAFEISMNYNQIFNKALNLGNGRVVGASHRGGNDINLTHFKYNSANNYNYGMLQVASTQHNCFPTMGYINDDLLVYFYSRRVGSSGFDQYINAKLYDTSVIGTSAPTVLATATEYNTGTQQIGQAPDCAVGRSTGTTNAFGIYVYNNTSDNKGRAVPFEVTFKQGNTGTNTVRMLPTGTSVLAQSTASTRSDTSNAYRNPVHVLALGTDPSDSSRFLYFCTTSPGYGWIIQQNTSTGAISTKVEGVLENVNSSNNFRRCDIHWFGMPGNGTRGILGGSYEYERVAAIIAGEFGTPSGDMYVGSAGLLFG